MICFNEFMDDNCLKWMQKDDKNFTSTTLFLNNTIYLYYYG